MLSGVVELLEQARRTSARAVNSIMTATYWEIGRRIVEHEQFGKSKADYGKQVVVVGAGVNTFFTDARRFSPVRLELTGRSGFRHGWMHSGLFATECGEGQ